jgi:glycosyltransferase involved in cell wall biosynthesis
MAARLKVAHLLGPSRGGIRRHVRYLSLNPPPGYETLGVWGPAELRPYFEGVPFHATRRFGGGPVGADIVHVHGLGAGFATLRRKRSPTVLTVHTDIETQGRTARSAPLRRAARAIAARADAVIAVSERVARAFPSARVIYPAVDARPAATRSRDEVRSELGTPTDAVVVICVARLHHDKGLGDFIGGVSALAPGVEGWICGDGPERERLESLAAGAPVRLLGYREDVSDLLGASDVFALPSVGEAYGIAVLEALQAGVPVVTSDAGAMPELVGDAGFIVPASNQQAFGDVLSRIVGNSSVRSELAARARARSFPSPLELVARVGEVYDEVTH